MDIGKAWEAAGLGVLIAIGYLWGPTVIKAAACVCGWTI